MKILICGSTGYGNIGDDAMRDIMILFINKYFPAIEITVTRPYPQEELVKETDAVIIGGGGIIYDWNQANFDYYTKYIRYAIENKKPIAMINIGEQGVEVTQNLVDLKLYMNYISVITVRQEHDRDFFVNHLGLDPSRIFLGHDVTYKGNPLPIKFTPLSKRPKVMIIPGSNYDNDVYDSMKQFIQEYRNKYDFYVSVTSYEDIKWLDKLANIIAKTHRGTRDFSYLTAPFISALLGEMDYVITSRFHGIIFAVVGGCKKILGMNFSKKIIAELPSQNVLLTPICYTPEIIENKMLNCKDILPPEDASIHLATLGGFIEAISKNAISRETK
jgi:exopolysaccharide biosynthesis predicted pyruvyltransferase EpsI